MRETMDLNEFYAGLDLMFQKNNGGETQRFLEGCLARAEQLGDLSAVTAVCNELGGFYRAAGKLEAAKEVGRRVLTNLEEMGLYRTEHYAAALINAGDICIAAKEYPQALDLFLQAKEQLEALGMDGDYRMAALCNNISAVYREIQDFESAERALAKAFSIIRGKAEYRGELGTTCINLAQLQIKQGKFREARENLAEAISIFEKEKGGKDPHYAAACGAMGEVGYFQGDYDTAAEYYRKAMTLIEQSMGRTPSYFTMEKNLQKVTELRKNSRNGG